MNEQLIVNWDSAMPGRVKRARGKDTFEYLKNKESLINKMKGIFHW